MLCRHRRNEDNDVFAYSGKPQRAYERMLSAVEEGALDAIVTWHLHRSPKELEAFIDLVEHRVVLRGTDPASRRLGADVIFFLTFPTASPP